jgi:hypothetical protein
MRKRECTNTPRRGALLRGRLWLTGLLMGALAIFRVRGDGQDDPHVRERDRKIKARTVTVVDDGATASPTAAATGQGHDRRRPRRDGDAEPRRPAGHHDSAGCAGQRRLRRCPDHSGRALPVLSAVTDVTDATPQDVDSGELSCVVATGGSDHTVWYSSPPPSRPSTRSAAAAAPAPRARPSMTRQSACSNPRAAPARPPRRRAATTAPPAPPTVAPAAVPAATSTRAPCPPS